MLFVGFPRFRDAGLRRPFCQGRRYDKQNLLFARRDGPWRHERRRRETGRKFATKGPLTCPNLVLEVCIRRRSAEQAAHSDDLTLVMEGVREHMVQYESGAAQGSPPFSRTLGQFGIEFCLWKALDIGNRFRHDARLHLLKRVDGWVVGIPPSLKGSILQTVHPMVFAGDDVDQLVANAGAAKARQLFDVFLGSETGRVSEQEVEAFVGPGVEVADSVFREHRRILAGRGCRGQGRGYWGEVTGRGKVTGSAKGHGLNGG